MNSAIPPGNFEMLSRLTSWTCADFLKLNNSLGQVVIAPCRMTLRLWMFIFKYKTVKYPEFHY